MGQKTLFEKLNIQYEEKDGLFYPLIYFDNSDGNLEVGKYGQMWMDFIKLEFPQRHHSLLRFGELKKKAVEVNAVAYELLEDIESEWLKKHKPHNKNSFIEIYSLRTEARMLAEEVVLHDVVNCFH